jgi:tRNA A37 threonylcarbamoyladenosine synthetase subunit TsaC/SUA5/YrdC
VGLLPTTEIAKIYGENTKKIAEQVKVMHEVGMSQDEIDFKTQELAKKASLPFDIAVEAAREAEKANNHVASSVDALSKEYNDLEGKVSSVLQAALDPGVGVDPQKILEGMGFPREDAINENARRLADIAANGLKGQDWMGEFQKEVPDIWQMLRLAQNPQEEAARLLQDFQDGLLTSPIDKAKAKEIIRRQITGDQNMAELTSQIAQELASEMGIPLQQALAAAQGTLGGSSGAGTEAAVSFGDAALAQVEGANTGSAVVTTVITQMKSQYPLLATAGGEAAKQWGDAFIAKVGENVPPQLINILTNLITPQVIAQLGQRGSLTGAVS